MSYFWSGLNVFILPFPAQFHSVSGPSQWPRTPLAAGLWFPAGRGCTRPHYVLLAAPSPRGLSVSAVSFAGAQVKSVSSLQCEEWCYLVDLFLFCFE